MGDLDGVPGAHHAHRRMVLLQPLDHVIFLGRGDEDAVIADLADFGVALEGLFETRIDRLPVIGGVIMGERELGLALLHRIAVDGDPGGVRSAVGHFDNHGFEHGTQLRLQLGILEIKSDDTAHGSSPLLG